MASGDSLDNSPTAEDLKAKVHKLRVSLTKWKGTQSIHLLYYLLLIILSNDSI